MHILVVNDDGPPSNQSSPYVHSLVTELEAAGHLVSVILPREQRSWIGKAHIIGQTVKPSYFRPGNLHDDNGVVSHRPSKEGGDWVLVDGTPASCVQIGLYHFFQDRGPVDIVVSGPNYGRNTTACFALSSGTLGGALEAAVCRRKAIAISYAFDSRTHDPEIIAGASRLSVKIVQHLYDNWDDDADVYTVNVPLKPDVENKKVVWTNMLQNYWSTESCFEAVSDDEGDANEEEAYIREGETPRTEGAPAAARHRHKHFKWSPRFTDVYKSVEESEPGNDGWVVKEGYTSVTALKANFMHSTSRKQGDEIKLQDSTSATLGIQDLSLSSSSKSRPPKHFYAAIDYGDEYVQPLLIKALQSRLPSDSYTLLKPGEAPPSEDAPVLHIRQYEDIPFEQAMSHSSTTLINAYIIRKALIRKHYLSTTAFNHIIKYRDSVLATHMKPTVSFEVDYAEFLDDALLEEYELLESLQKNEELPDEEKEWWILKPGMSDRGQGIRLFNSMEALQEIFEEWDPESDDEEDEEGAERVANDDDNGIMTSQLRHFVAQPYIHSPLLIEGNPNKFHIRTYVLCVGALKIYVWKPMLALFAGKPYVAPGSSTGDVDEELDLGGHLTNTCLQNGAHDGSVQAFWSLPSSQSGLPSTWKESVFEQIRQTTGEIFEAAARGMSIHFQPLPNAFEVFGLDFLVDAQGTPWLLEVNAFPDFKQTGDELNGVVEGLWEGVVDVAVAPFFGGEVHENHNMVSAREVDLGRK